MADPNPDDELEIDYTVRIELRPVNPIPVRVVIEAGMWLARKVDSMLGRHLTVAVKWERDPVDPG